MSKNAQRIVAFPSNVEDMALLDTIAELEDRSISWLIRDAIRKYNESYFGVPERVVLTDEELRKLANEVNKWK